MDDCKAPIVTVQSISQVMIIHKYVTKELLKWFCIVLSTVVGIYLTVDFFGNIDSFLDAKLAVSRAVVFFVLKIPFMVAQVTPVGVLLSVLIVFGLMVRNNEIIALRSGGVSNYYLVKPVLVLGLIFSALLFFFSEVFVPITMGKANEIRCSEVEGGSAVSSREKNIWIKGNRSVFHIKYFRPSDNTMFGITLHYFDRNFRLIRRVDAQRGVYTGETWQLFDVVEQVLLEDDGSYDVICRPESPARLEFVPEDLNTVVKKCEEMTYGELSEYIREVEEEGYDATGYRVDLSAKIAFPFVCLIMGIVGIGLTFWRRKKEGIAGSIFYGIGIAFSYWTLHSFCLTLGYGAILPPMAAAWLTNLIFASLGTLMLLNAR